jgi:dihydroneopterin aldolase
MSDRIVLAGMAFQARHGVNEREKLEAQRFEVDVVVELDRHAAGRADHPARTHDYRGVYDVVRQVMDGPPVDLIEALAESIARDVLDASLDVREVVVRVRKPEVSLGSPLDYAGVEIRRGREV